MKEIQRYHFSRILICYFENPLGGVEWVILPKEKESELNLPSRNKFDSLVQVKLAADDYPKGFVTGSSMRNSQTVQGLRYSTQRITETEKIFEIITLLVDQHGNYYQHHCLVDCQTDIIESFVVFINKSGREQLLEYLSSFSLSCLSPFNERNSAGNLELTRYRSKWSYEGRKKKRPIEEYQLEPSWKPSGVGLEKFGQVGSMPVRNWFPNIGLSDKKNNVSWSARLAHPGSWQMEAYRLDEDICLSGGLADRDFGHWSKKLMSGEKFETPHAYLTTCIGTEEDCGNHLNSFFSRKVSENNHDSEETLAVMFNEFCTTWGKPSADSITEMIPVVKRHEIDYFIIDAGWYASPSNGWEKNMGDWLPNSRQFPQGIGTVIKKIREADLVPGIWFELEIVGRDATAFSFLEHLLQKDGQPITTGDRRFWNMNDPWVLDYLYEKVIKFLQENEIGYLKIDYNDNFGVGFDGCESYGEENRKQLLGTQLFFKKIREALPELVIENCSSGGHRLEPSMMMLTDLSSFSDAHEAVSIPIIGGNLQELIPTRQALMWAVIREEDTLQRIYYSITANFLGRLCLSGDVMKLSEEQWEVIDEGISFYRTIRNIIKSGNSHRFGVPALSYRQPEGSQGIIRYNDEQNEALIVLHSFSNPQKISIPIEEDFRVIATYGEEIIISREGVNWLFQFTKEFQGAAIYLKRDELK